MFNLQSGRHRQSFPATLASRSQTQRGISSVSATKSTATKHIKAVTGIVIDGLNQTVISCGLDGKIKVSIFRLHSSGCGHDGNFVGSFGTLSPAGLLTSLTGIQWLP